MFLYGSCLIHTETKCEEIAAMKVEFQQKQELLSKAEKEKKNVTKTLNQELNKAFGNMNEMSKDHTNLKVYEFENMSQL